MTVPMHTDLSPLFAFVCVRSMGEWCRGSLALRAVPPQARHLVWAGTGVTSSLPARFSANHLPLTAGLGNDLSVFHALGTWCKHVLVWWMTRES